MVGVPVALFVAPPPSIARVPVCTAVTVCVTPGMRSALPRVEYSLRGRRSNPSRGPGRSAGAAGPTPRWRRGSGVEIAAPYGGSPARRGCEARSGLRGRRRLGGREGRWESRAGRGGRGGESGASARRRELARERRAGAAGAGGAAMATMEKLMKAFESLRSFQQQQVPAEESLQRP